MALKVISPLYRPGSVCGGIKMFSRGLTEKMVRLFSVSSLSSLVSGVTVNNLARSPRPVSFLSGPASIIAGVSDWLTILTVPGVKVMLLAEMEPLPESALRSVMLK